jgi:putative ABC transport system substrate-binding protein
MGKVMRRREAIASLVFAAVCPHWAGAQPLSPVIGFLFPFGLTSPVMQPYLAAFRRGLKEGGFVESQNLTIEYRAADGHLDRLPSLAADLVSIQPAVIVAAQLPAALAAKAAASSIPLVFTAGDDPVRTGLVAAINRPGGNATGVNPIVTSLDDKRLALLKELVPDAKQIAVLFNPKSPDVSSHFTNLQAASQSLGINLSIVHASTDAEFEQAFASFDARKPSALLVGADPLFSIQVGRLIELAARYQLPTMYSLRLDAVAGGLMCYGPNLTDSYRILGQYTARVLNGEKPSEMPVWQTVRFELVINLKTARVLDLTVPPTLLARADEVIE